MDKELEKAIKAADRYHRQHPATNVMVVYSKYGGYQGFSERKTVSEEFQVLHRTSTGICS